MDKPQYIGKVGRPVGYSKEEYQTRKQRQIRAHDDEWELVKRFVALMRKDKEQCRLAIEVLEENLKE